MHNVVRNQIILQNRGSLWRIACSVVAMCDGVHVGRREAGHHWRNLKSNTKSLKKSERLVQYTVLYV